MFIGHYGPGFAVKSFRPEIPLAVLFLAGQLVDIAWAVLVLLGIEKFRIVPGITASSPLDLYYMPFSHSLAATVPWAVAAVLVCRPLRGVRAWSAALWVGVVVLSHWPLDWLVHRPDLPLYDDAAKVGLGLWNYPVSAFALEALVLFAGMILYLRRTRPVNAIGRFGAPVFGLVMLAVQAYAFFGPPPDAPRTVAASLLALYIVFAAVIQWLDRQRRERFPAEAFQ